MNHRVSLKLVGAILAPAVLVAFVIGLIVAGILNLNPGRAAENDHLAVIGQGLGPTDHSPFVQVADSVLPAVVNISAEKTVKLTGRSQDDAGPGSPLEQLFRDFFREMPEIPPERQQNALGSGVVITPDGYIVTNNHVVAGFDKIVVRLSDDTEFKGKDVRVVGRDPKTDLAVIKVTGKSALPCVRLANAQDIKVGDWAVAVGNPFGLSGTVTVGVVSAKGRSGIPLAEGPTYQDFIQTDASINPGNSGGALVNIKGELMGINSAIRSPVGASVGIGFAVPVNIVKSVTDQLIRSGRVVRGYMGVRPQPVTEAIRRAMNLPDTKGVLVSEVVADAPAEKAGIEDGDVITAVNGQRTEGVEQFRQQVADFTPGTTISVALVRDGDRLTRRVKLTEFPEEQAEASAPVEDQAAKWLGLSVRALTGDERDRANVRSGVVVSAIQVGSAAAEAGIERGDIILEAGSEKISGMADYSRIARAYSRSGDPVLLRIMRGSNKLFIAVEPTE
jgi:serine protease Do